MHLRFASTHWALECKPFWLGVDVIGSHGQYCHTHHPPPTCPCRVHPPHTHPTSHSFVDASSTCFPSSLVVGSKVLPPSKGHLLWASEPKERMSELRAWLAAWPVTPVWPS